MKEIYKDFQKWHKTFCEEYDGFIPDEEWFNRVQKAHKKLRKFLNGVDIQKIVTTKKSSQLLDDATCEGHLTKIVRAVLPSAGELLNKDIFKSSTMKDSKGRQIKTTRHVRKIIEKNLKEKGYTGYNLSDKLYYLDDILSRLGKDWSSLTTEDISYRMILSTSAKSFTMLGHHDVDEESCFRNGHENDYHKYRLGQTKNTFTLVVTTPEKKDTKIVARLWGFSNNKFDTFSFCNAYFDKGIKEGNIFGCIKKLVGNILNIDEVKSEVDSNIYVQSGVYHNEFPNWSFSSKKIDEEIILVPDLSWITEPYCCDLCDKLCHGKHHELSGGYYACKECFEKAKVCSMCDTKMYEGIFVVAEDNKTELEVCHGCYNKNYKYCINCYLYKHRSIVSADKGTGLYSCNTCLSKAPKPKLEKARR